MLNQVVLVGRLANDIEVKEVDGKKILNITLAVPRSFKNSDGEYETDFIPVILWNMVAENTAEYYKKGNIVGIKGRIQIYENNIEIIGEKVTFLSSNTKEEVDE